jgi:phosphoglycolate phosphatase
MSYKHVIWDWNGTLLDDVNIGVKILNYMQKKRNISETGFDEYRKIFTFPVEKYYERAGLMESGLSFKELAEDYIEQYNIAVESMELYKDAKEVLERLDDSGVTSSILTAAPEDLVKSQLKKYGIANYFIALTRKTNHYSSGKEDLAEVHMDKLDISPSNTVFVGDTMHDVKVANKIRCDYIIVSHGHQDIKYLSKGEINTMHDLNEVADNILNS